MAKCVIQVIIICLERCRLMWRGAHGVTSAVAALCHLLEPFLLKRKSEVVLLLFGYCPYELLNSPGLLNSSGIPFSASLVSRYVLPIDTIFLSSDFSACCWTVSPQTPFTSFSENITKEQSVHFLLLWMHPHFTKAWSIGTVTYYVRTAYQYCRLSLQIWQARLYVK